MYLKVDQDTEAMIAIRTAPLAGPSKIEKKPSPVSRPRVP